MSEKSCPKLVPGLTNMPRKYQTGKPTSNIYTSASSIVNEVIRAIFFFPLRENFTSIKNINKRLSLKCTLA